MRCLRGIWADSLLGHGSFGLFDTGSGVKQPIWPFLGGAILAHWIRPLTPNARARGLLIHGLFGPFLAFWEPLYTETWVVLAISLKRSHLALLAKLTNGPVKDLAKPGI